MSLEKVGILNLTNYSDRDILFYQENYFDHDLEYYVDPSDTIPNAHIVYISFSSNKEYPVLIQDTE
jgi:hypothetical protein